MLMSVAHGKLALMAMVAMLLGVGLIAFGAFVQEVPQVGRIGEYLIVTAVAWGTVTSKKED